MKVELATEASGLPVGVATGAADVSETPLAGAAPADISAPVPPGVPVVADRGSDSDPLRERPAAEGFTPVARRRKGRERKPTADGRRSRRLVRRRKVARTFARLHGHRRVATRFGRRVDLYDTRDIHQLSVCLVATRFERRVDLYDGFVHLALAFMSLNRLVK